MSSIDCEIKGVMSGILVACLLIGVIEAHKEPQKICVAILKDQSGTTHEIMGYVKND